MTLALNTAPSIRRVSPALLVALLLAGGIGAWNVHHLACVSRDGTHYVTFARQLARDPVFYLRAHRSQPGYSTSILAIHALLPASWTTDPVLSRQRIGQMIAWIGFVACVPLLYLLARRLFDERVAATAAILAALWPGAAQLGGDVLSDMPHLAIFLATLLAVDTALQRRSSVRWLIVGIAGGVAYLFRQEALSLPIASLLCLGWYALRREIHGTAAIRSAVVLLFGFGLMVTPYVGVTGNLFHKKGLSELLFGPPRATSSTPASRDSLTSARVAEIPGVVRHGVNMLDGWARSGRYVHSTLALAALLMGVRSRAANITRLLFLILLLHSGAVALRGSSFGVISSRYMLIPAALTLPWAATGLCRIVDLVAGHRSGVSRRAVWAVGWFAIAGITLPYATRTIHADDAYLREAGQWLHTESRPDDELLAEHRACQVTFYADRRWNEWPGEAWPLEEILAHDVEAQARWYVHFDGARGDVSHDDALIEHMLIHPRWPAARLVHRRGPRGREVRIIQLRP